MSLKRLAVPAAAAAGVFLWWSSTSRAPAPDARALLMTRAEPQAPAEAPDGPVPAEEAEAPPEAAPAAELPPPEPVLAESAQRRFSSPAAQAAAGGIAGAEPSGAFSAGPGFEPNLPGGYAAPTAGAGRLPEATAA
ncbi:MAG: hypothetical protein NDJ72_11075, partial [Elusimicrobia bacterium]|nr:hypothetical protein [Elusimicrobiota bacterium]